MKKTFDFYYVESPLQLLSAIDAKRNTLKKTILVVNLSSGDRSANDTQIRTLLIKKDWDKVYLQKNYTYKHLNTILKLLRTFILYFKYKNKISSFYYGEFRNLHMTALGRSLKPSNMVLLDDGVFTITAQNYYILNNKIPYNLDVIETKIYNALLNINLNKPQVPHLFSFFDFKHSLLEGQINYFQMKPRKEVILDEKSTYFFGSKLSEAKILTKEAELKILESVYCKYGQNSIYYIPHRDDDPSKLKKISQIGYIVKSLGRPAELFFDEASKMPCTVISCVSTTLYSCFARFSNVKIIAIDIRSYILCNKVKINIDNIYLFYKNTGIIIDDSLCA